MNSPLTAPVDFRQIVTTLQTRWRWWVLPTAAMTVLGLGYALVKPAIWQARQGLVVRDEAVGDLSRQGRFDNSYALKSAQEMVLEVARHRAVVEAALQSVGPRDRKNSSNWPASDDVQSLQDAINVSAPKGAEFGQTEVIYLSVKDRDRQRAVTLTAAVCDQLEHRLQELRARKAQSLIDELTRTAGLAKKDLDEATTRLQAIESQVGSDLGELRTLSEAGSGDSHLRGSLNQIKSDLRQATASRTATEEQLQLLQAARRDEKQLIATSGRLLEAQPTLRRLKDGLVDAQLRTATLRGRMSADHPQVREAVAAEEEVRQRLQRELDAAIAGLQADLRVTGAQIATYEQQLAEVTARLDRLASMRATYSNLQTDVRQRTAIVEKAQQDLATARASQAAAASASLLTRLDGPLADDQPLGPGRATIVLAGLVGGLATGLGLVFLTAPVGRQWGRRWSDYLRYGRRATDLPAASTEDAQPGRRPTDPPPSPPGEDQNYGRRADDRNYGRRATDAPRNRRATDVPTGSAPLPPTSEPATNRPAPAAPSVTTMPADVPLYRWVAAADVSPPMDSVATVTAPARKEKPDSAESLSLTETLARLALEPKPRD